MSDDLAQLRALRQAGQLRAAVRDVYRAGALATSCGLGVDPDLPGPVRWWARATVLTSERVVEDVLVQGHANGLDALGALAQAVTERLARPVLHLPDDVRRTEP